MSIVSKFCPKIPKEYKGHYPIKKILETTPINDHFSSFYSEETQTYDHFSEKFYIGLRQLLE
jgi:hypothetical protein